MQTPQPRFGGAILLSGAPEPRLTGRKVFRVFAHRKRKRRPEAPLSFRPTVENLYTLLRRRRIRPNPSRAEPNSAMLAGSGTTSGASDWTWTVRLLGKPKPEAVADARN